MKPLWIVLFSWALLVVQSVLVRAWGWGVTRVDVTVVAVVFLALRASTLEGAAASFACGYLLDVMGGQPTGLYTFLAVLTFLVARVFGSLVEVRSALSFALFAAAADAGHGLLAVFFSWLTSREGSIFSGALSSVPLQVLLTGLAGLFLYPVLRRWESGPDRSRLGELR